MSLSLLLASLVRAANVPLISLSVPRSGVLVLLAPRCLNVDRGRHAGSPAFVGVAFIIASSRSYGTDIYLTLALRPRRWSMHSLLLRAAAAKCLLLIVGVPIAGLENLIKLLFAAAIHD